MREDWMAFNDTEIFNVARTVDLARVYGVSAVRVPSSRVDWLREQFSGFGFGIGGFGQGPFGGGPVDDYTDLSGIEQAPWWVGGPVSTSFLGAIPLSVKGIDDSTRTSTTTQYVGDGGFTGIPRSGTKTLVFSAVLVATNEAGADYGKRWLTSVLSQRSDRGFCQGASLNYFRTSYAPVTYTSGGQPLHTAIDRLHLRDVRLTRGITVTRKTKRSCYTFWVISFTMEAGDPYEYTDAVTVLRKLGIPQTSDPNGPVAENLATVQDSNTSTLNTVLCPTADYTPLYDPAYPALDPPPQTPDFLPQNWYWTNGAKFRRYQAKVLAEFVQIHEVESVPVVTVSTVEAARMVRFSLYPSESSSTEQCSAYYGFVLTYVPANSEITVDAEQRIAYATDLTTGQVRRCDSLLLGYDGRPLDWDTSSLTDLKGVTFRAALDLPYINAVAGTIQGGGTLEASVSMVGKSN